jgi:ABC-type branched-subunit amino acid transport system permease subunit
MTEPLQPGRPDPERSGEDDRPRVGVDEWVASFGRRRQKATGVSGAALDLWATLPPFGRLAVAVIPAAFLPLIMNEGNLFRFGLYTLLYAMMGLGLNVAVGFAGLLDLGYIAFVGFGAYGYGVLASSQFGHHWQAEAAVPIVTLATALLGLLVGLPSRRLVGDYLAIVTLFFGQAFVVFVNNANRINFCWPVSTCHTDLTGGSNGLANIDPLNLFGYKLSSTTQKYYLLLIAISIVLAALFFANQSRTGRALRALREDPLAAEAMGMPVNRLKLLAFAFGAAIAGFTGTIYGSVQTGAFPGDYDVGLLITIYAVVILGGSGSLAGAVVGAIIINGVPEIMRTQQDAGWLFYGVILLTILLKLRPWRKCALLLGSLVAFGFAVHAICDAISSSLTAAHAVAQGVLGTVTEAWVLLPTDPTRAADFCYVFLIAAILLVTRLHGAWRYVALVPTLYLAAFVWENLLVHQTVGATRLILLGALLVALMNARPQGILGAARVEIV